MTNLAADTFIRADSSGSWGNASDGQTWARIDGAGTPSIVSNRGEIQAFASQDTTMRLGSGTTAGINFLVRATILGGNGGPVWRIQDANHFYRLVVEDDGIVYLQVKTGAFSFSTITTASVPSWDRLQEWWIRVIHTTSNDIEVRVWLDGDTEPSTPLISTNDTSITSAGGYGVISVGYDNGHPYTNYFDSLTVTDGVSGTDYTLDVDDSSFSNDTVSGALISSASDSNAASDTQSGQFALSINDVSAGSDSVVGQHTTATSDNATASETVTIAFQFLAQDQSSAMETRTFFTVLSRSDSATATDTFDFNPPVTNVPTLVLAARCRDGIVKAQCRDGILKGRAA